MLLLSTKLLAMSKKSCIRAMKSEATGDAASDDDIACDICDKIVGDVACDDHSQTSV
jgi:hypothetical protein